MCLFQVVFFVKNGNNMSGTSCSAYTTDRIETDTTITFYSSEVGKTVRVGVTIHYPDGIDRTRWSSTFVVSSTGTYDFIIPVDLSIAGTGNYSITWSEAWDYITPGSIPMCAANYSGGFCQSLTISAPPCPQSTISMTIS